MEKIGEPCAASTVVNNVEDGIKFTNTIGYPVVLRPAFTLGGSGGGIAHNQEELVDILSNGLRLSRVNEVLVERCIAGWKEIEFEVMRDSAGNVIQICSMENIDPVASTPATPSWWPPPRPWRTRSSRCSARRLWTSSPTWGSWVLQRAAGIEPGEL